MDVIHGLKLSAEFYTLDNLCTAKLLNTTPMDLSGDVGIYIPPLQ